jgi:hypothetical protein
VIREADGYEGDRNGARRVLGTLRAFFIDSIYARIF